MMRPLAAVLPIFLITRAAIFFAATASTDTLIYHAYGAFARSNSVAELFRVHDVEYPQLAVTFGAAVDLLAASLPQGSERIISARRAVARNPDTARFQVAFGMVLFTLDLSLLLAIAKLTKSLDDIQQKWALGVYIAGGAALGPIIYDRLDLVVGAAAFAALVLFAQQRPTLAYAVLTLGAAYKLVPLLLVPVFVLGTASRSPRFWPAFLRQAAIAGAILALWPLLAYLFGGGDRAFVYLKYHGERGPELGSAWSSPLFCFNGTGVVYTFGGYTVVGPAADVVTRISPFVTLLALGLAILVSGRALQRTRGELSVLVSSCVLVWLAFILTNKVGSPQYLLWLVPLVALMSLQTRSQRIWAGGFTAAAGVATLTYPYLWPTVHGARLTQHPETWAGPNAIGFGLLFLRWVSLAVITVWLVVRLWNVPPVSQSTLPENAT